MLRSFLLLALFATGALTGCNTFDPTLGDNPFRCGTGEPRCPEGFSCVTVAPGDDQCFADGVDGGGGGGGTDGGGGNGQVDCSSDMVLEPNNTTQQATTTTIPAQDSFNLVNLAVCSGDIDYYRFDTGSGLFNIRATVNYTAAQGELTVEVVNSLDTAIATGAAEGGNPDVLTANVQAAAGSQTYYAKVSSDSPTTENNYDISISIAATN